VANMEEDQTKDKVAWKSNVNTIVESLPSLLETPLEVKNSSSPIPTLLVAGRKASYVREERIPDLQALFPNLKVCWMDTGHWVQAEKPAELISILSEFIQAPTDP